MHVFILYEEIEYEGTNILGVYEDSPNQIAKAKLYAEEWCGRELIWESVEDSGDSLISRTGGWEVWSMRLEKWQVE